MGDTDRDRLIEFRAQADDAFDSTLLKLSGGALGLSLAFVRQFIGAGAPQAVWALQLAWLLWATSLLSGVASYYSSGAAMEQATLQHDKGDTATGEPFTNVTRWLNRANGGCFALGVLFAVIFMNCNLGGPPMPTDDSQSTSRTAVVDDSAREERGRVTPTPVNRPQGESGGQSGGQSDQKTGDSSDR